ncbi:MAG: phosphoribosylamine--glycine ligase [Alteromonas macleodii]|jgi:phosphoribosylamine--glycine ligase
MNILILGAGGREHSLAWAIKQNPKCDRIIVAPGNAGISEIAECSTFDIEDGEVVAEFCAKNAIDFVIIGPEAPLVAGVSDVLRKKGIVVLGCSQAAAQLEASKSFTKEICNACDAPTARYGHFTEANTACDYATAQGAPIVIKADGLAAGKGVVVAMDIATAHAAINDMLGGLFGVAGAEVVVEEFMEGEEASFFILCDSTSILPIGTAQDHKRAYDGDKGPNTGGMGAYSPAPILTDDIAAIALRDIIEPTIAEMVKRGTPFQGILYAGLMIKDGLPRLVEYNVRFGDPECQVLMMRLGGQVLDLLHACAENRLSDITPNWGNDHAMTVVMATKGYPGSYKNGTPINNLVFLPKTSSEMTFHAGTAFKDGQIVATGGRVLNVTSRGETLKSAHTKAYAMVHQIDWPDGFYRTDIGNSAL